jgi:PAS domain-containing protein
LVHWEREQETGPDVEDRAIEDSSRFVLETAHEAFVAMDAGGFITDWNPAAEATFGWSREEAVGRVLHRDPGGPPGGAGQVERLCAAMPAGVTCSAGLASWDGDESGDELLRRADRALYEAKRAGRDGIAVAD